LCVRALSAGVLIAILSIPGTCRPQQSQSPQPAQQGMGGISSAGTFAPVYDAQKRPITAGGFVDSGAVVFEDATRASGLSSWKHVMSSDQRPHFGLGDATGARRRFTGLQAPGKQ
jgi:hypothetical protein